MTYQITTAYEDIDTVRAKITLDHSVELYQSLGFTKIAAYYHNHYPDVIYMQFKIV